MAILKLQDTRIELMEPTADDSPIKKFLTDRGEGIHHIAITADDIENDVERAIANGTRMIGNIRTGSYGRKITFIHPKSMNGVLTEFCQAPWVVHGEKRDRSLRQHERPAATTPKKSWQPFFALVGCGCHNCLNFLKSES